MIFCPGRFNRNAYANHLTGITVTHLIGRSPNIAPLYCRAIGTEFGLENSTKANLHKKEKTKKIKYCYTPTPRPIEHPPHDPSSPYCYAFHSSPPYKSALIPPLHMYRAP